MFVYVSQKVMVVHEILWDSLTFQRTMEPYLDLDLCLLMSASTTLYNWSNEMCFYISIVKPTRCTSVSNYFILEWHSTRFGRSFRPSSRVQDCTYSNRHLSNRYCCLFASKQTIVSAVLLMMDGKTIWNM